MELQTWPHPEECLYLIVNCHNKILKSVKTVQYILKHNIITKSMYVRFFVVVFSETLFTKKLTPFEYINHLKFFVIKSHTLTSLSMSRKAYLMLGSSRVIAGLLPIPSSLRITLIMLLQQLWINCNGTGTLELPSYVSYCIIIVKFQGYKLIYQNLVLIKIHTLRRS